MLYALPSQAEQVAAIGQQVGLPTILAMVQILDQTAARLRVSLHARTLVEMAIVRICTLENLDDLAGLVAELRAQSGASLPPDAAKKNIEPRPRLTLPNVPTSERPAAVDSIGTIPRLAEPVKNGVSPPTTAAVTSAPAVAPTPIQPKTESVPSTPANGDRGWRGISIRTISQRVGGSSPVAGG